MKSLSALICVKIWHNQMKMERLRLLGLDYGDKTIGVAVSDDLFLTAQSVEVIRRENAQSFKKSIARLSELIKTYGVTAIVLGYPKNMDNSEGARCQITLEFKARLERNFKKTPVILWDERLSTAAADRALAALARKARGSVIDKVAAAVILQSFMDAENAKKENEENA